MERVLLTHDQVRAYGLPAAAGKAGDPRWAGFADRYGLDAGRPVQWEVEALDPAELQRLVLAAVAPHVDQALLDARIAEEELQRDRLRAFTAEWPDGRPRGGCRPDAERGISVANPFSASRKPEKWEPGRGPS
ncbi:hypothetical protein [Streptomyces globosus]|uniref:hypothetical protein n=1 Tax=Streptomyces globosus TaxID=68209 RepID=UPI0031D6F43D